jgi:hypothetical protein
MLKKVQMKLHSCLCVLACFPVAISDQLQAFTISGSNVSLAKQRLYGLKGVLVWEILSRMILAWHLLDKGFLCNLEHFA